MTIDYYLKVVEDLLMQIQVTETTFNKPIFIEYDLTKYVFHSINTCRYRIYFSMSLRNSRHMTFKLYLTCYGVDLIGLFHCHLIPMLFHHGNL